MNNQAGKYTAEDIGIMRHWVRQIIIYQDGRASSQKLEEQLQTYMMNGTTPDELEREAARVKELYDGREV